MTSPSGTDQGTAGPGTESTILRIVSGKGGVGRTTVSAALAENAAAAGKRVLAVDATDSGGLQQLLRRSSSTQKFDTLRLTTRSALDEYLKIYLRLPLGPSRLGPLAKIFDYVSAAAPGVRELLIIGKIGWEVRNGSWDEIIVDAPATGHVVELLSAPSAMAELIPTGPLAQQTGWLSDVLAATTTSIILVTIPEELPVTETGELSARILAETATSIAGVVVNKTPPIVAKAGIVEAKKLAEVEAGPDGNRLAASAALVSFRSQAATLQLARLADLTLPTVVVPERIGSPIDAVLDALVGSWLDHT